MAFSSSSGAGGCQNLNLGIGFRFNPMDEELLEYYLQRKVSGELSCTPSIMELNIYQHDPWSLPWRHERRRFIRNERYYFVRREKLGNSVTGQRPKRSSTGESSDGGWWKASNGDVGVYKEGKLLGYKKTLKFMKYRDEKKIRSQAIKTDWLMHEFRLPSETFQEWVLCRIKKKKTKGMTDSDMDTESDSEAEAEANKDTPDRWQISTKSLAYYVLLQRSYRNLQANQGSNSSPQVGFYQHQQQVLQIQSAAASGPISPQLGFDQHQQLLLQIQSAAASDPIGPQVGFYQHQQQLHLQVGFDQHQQQVLQIQSAAASGSISPQLGFDQHQQLLLQIQSAAASDPISPQEGFDQHQQQLHLQVGFDQHQQQLVQIQPAAASDPISPQVKFDQHRQQLLQIQPAAASDPIDSSILQN